MKQTLQSWANTSDSPSVIKLHDDMMLEITTVMSLQESKLNPGGFSQDEILQKEFCQSQLNASDLNTQAGLSNIEKTSKKFDEADAKISQEIERQIRFKERGEATLKNQTDESKRKALVETLEQVNASIEQLMTFKTKNAEQKEQFQLQTNPLKEQAKGLSEKRQELNAELNNISPQGSDTQWTMGEDRNLGAEIQQLYSNAGDFFSTCLTIVRSALSAIAKTFSELSGNQENFNNIEQSFNNSYGAEWSNTVRSTA
jgi:hypothetical protein